MTVATLLVRIGHVWILFYMRYMCLYRDQVLQLSVATVKWRVWGARKYFPLIQSVWREKSWLQYSRHNKYSRIICWFDPSNTMDESSFKLSKSISNNMILNFQKHFDSFHFSKKKCRAPFIGSCSKLERNNYSQIQIFGAIRNKFVAMIRKLTFSPFLIWSLIFHDQAASFWSNKTKWFVYIYCDHCM